MRVKLTPHEVQAGAIIGIERHIQAMAKGLKDKHGLRAQDRWRVHIEGACGEIAFAKAMNMYWSPSVNTFKGHPDIGSFEIRTRSQQNYDLLVREDDEDDRIFVLVVGMAPQFRLVGWLTGKEAKQQRYLQTYGDRPPAYFVPQDKLHSIESLRCLNSSS